MQLRRGPHGDSNAVLPVVMAWLAAALVLLGATGIFVASPNQQLFAPGRRAARALRAMAAATLLAGMVLWMAALHPAAGFFSALTLTMLAWVLLPYVAASTGRRQTRRSHDAPR